MPLQPEPPDKTTNRFSLLSQFDDYTSDYSFPPLTYKQTSLNQPKYITIKSPNNELQKLSPFVIKKSLDAISTQIENIKQLKDGSLLILTRNSKVAEKFLKLKTIANLCPVTTKYQDNLNTIKGIIYAPCLNEVNEEEILRELKIQGVTGIYKFTRMTEGKVVPTGKIVLSFDLYHLPKVIDIAWYKVKVAPYYPTPMRCKNCQLLGHTKIRCTNTATCEGCNLPPHSPSDCTRKQCANCGSDHASSDKDCPRFKQTQEILKIKTITKCSMGEALRKYNENNTQTVKSKSTYANVTITSQSTSTNKTPSSPTTTSTTIAKRPASSPPTKTNISKLQKTKNSLETNSLNNPTNKTTSNSLTQTANAKQTQNSPHHISQQTNNILESLSTISPCSKITQELLKKNDYFMPISDSDEEPKL
ncbi:uncharacterized protein LOC128855121 [Anastrepha ludens]|uniref:uncharacterized protein LOC128855121 n=1 Tax=Anastrepha ludens TaxID=28586 RepID=UPI0023B066E0|nr:uncharacterized protein LOC128855121 [Anastrepha ludens]